MIKARPCAGDTKAGEALIAELAPLSGESTWTLRHWPMSMT